MLPNTKRVRTGFDDMDADAGSWATGQEQFWASEFGDEYTHRNVGVNRIASNTALFAKILSRTHGVKSLIEFGANIGLNLDGIGNLLPNAELAAVEINPTAAEKLRSIADTYEQSILDFKADRQWDLALVKGVLIHIDPDHLPRVYDALYEASGRYICLVEYYNPTPVEVPYRGHAGRLFKRDFAGEVLDRFPDLHVVDYGFTWRRDPNFAQDDTCWFLLEKA